VKRRPPVRVLGVNIAPKSDQELYDVDVAGADCVVEGRDPLVISGGRVFHLTSRFAHQVQLPFQRRVQKQGQRET